MVKEPSLESLVKRPTTPPDYSPRLDTSTRHRRVSRQQNKEHPITNDLVVPRFIIGQQPDSLDSNYHNKSSINDNFRVSYEDLAGLSLPNYYPDSNTDNTDNISLTDEISTESGDNSHRKKYFSCDNLSQFGIWSINENESISYDENIVLSANRPLYDSLREKHYAKPRTIRGPTPYNQEKQTYYKEKPKKNPNYASDSSDDNKGKEETQISLDYFETDTNFDEIKLKNENIEIEDPQETSEVVKVAEDPPKDNLITNQTIIEIEAPPETHKDQNEEYKTIVTVDPDSDQTQADEEKSKHSHNYLREFLESQKGSKRPLQNFLTKKLSNLSRKNSKEPDSNLTENQFYSLPDITAGKNLRKCEKIDRKLRKCEKNNSIRKTLEGNNENRFIVNIGKHFNITEHNQNIPVDFELKIAKVPKRKVGKNNNKEDQFVKTVQNETFSNTSEENKVKPEIVGVTTKIQETNKEQEEEEAAMSLVESGNACTKEYQEKLDTMRNYWDKMLNRNTDNPNLPPEEKNIEKPPHKCKIVDIQTKIVDVKKKFESNNEAIKEEKPNMVQITKQLFERNSPEKTDKISPFIKESCNYFENNQFESLSPNIVEIINKDNNDQNNNQSKIKENTKHNTISKTKKTECPEFDHVRYRVVKSDLFQKKIFANCEKESQFDGLMQYLQDYSFQELLRDNNIVIIEPIRSKIQHETSKNAKAPKNITPYLHKTKKCHDATDSNGLKRHFFYHPIRVNKEVNEDELPNPDTVKLVRQFFEGELKRSQSSQYFEGAEAHRPVKTDPDKDHCSATTDSTSNPSNMSDFDDSQENLYDSIGHCCEQQYVSEDILEKIREYGTTVTYYGGRMVKKQCENPSLTRIIMEEIKNNEKQNCECCKKNKDDVYQGVKFRLVKSNSCNSRLELVGTNDIQDSKMKYIKNKQKQKRNNKNLKSVKETAETEKVIDKNIINENIRKNLDQPKIIGEQEKRMTQWGDTTKEKTFNVISFNEKPRQNINYDYHINDNLKKNSKTIDDMEFEPYEVA